MNDIEPATSETEVEPEAHEPFSTLVDEDYTEQNAEAPAHE